MIDATETKRCVGCEREVCTLHTACPYCGRDFVQDEAYEFANRQDLRAVPEHWRVKIRMAIVRGYLGAHGRVG